MRTHILILMLILLPWQALADEEFLFLCEINWRSGELAKARCMKEKFGKDDRISESALEGIHKVQLANMKSRFPAGECATRSNRTRMSLDVRTTCKTEARIIEFASIWPLDARTKQYFRSSMPEIIEDKVLTFFKRTHFKSESKEPMFNWNK